MNKDETDCIWNNRYNVKFFKDRRTEIGERLFDALYQQKPLDTTGDFFNLDKVIFNGQDTNNIKSKCRSWDLAYSDESKGNVNDYTASCLMKRTIDDYYIINEITYGQYGERLNNILKSTAYLDTPNTPILIETGTSGGASKFYFQELKKNYLQGYNVKQSEPIGSKEDRAAPLRDAILDGKIIINVDDETRSRVIEQLKSFPLGAHDDIVDAISYAYNHLTSFEGDVIRTSKHKKRRVRLL